MNIKTISLYCLLLPRILAADDSVYRFGRDIVNPDSGQQTLLAVALDTAVYAAGNADFSDLRICDSAGAETPYLLQKIAGRKTVVKRMPSRGEKPQLRKQGKTALW